MNSKNISTKLSNYALKSVSMPKPTKTFEQSTLPRFSEKHKPIWLLCTLVEVERTRREHWASYRRPTWYGTSAINRDTKLEKTLDSKIKVANKKWCVKNYVDNNELVVFVLSFKWRVLKNVLERRNGTFLGMWFLDNLPFSVS